MTEFDLNGNEIEIKEHSISINEIEKLITSFENHQNYRITHIVAPYCRACGKIYKRALRCSRCGNLLYNDDTDVFAKTKDTRIKNGGLIGFGFNYGQMKRIELKDIVSISVLGHSYKIKK